jgi:hypothetical protein
MRRASDAKKSSGRPPVPAAAPKMVTPSFAPPYPPSWINRFVEWVVRLPGPGWAFYILASIVLVALQWALQSAAGRAVNGFNLLVAVTVPYELGLMHYLIRTSAGALDEFRPALRATRTEAEALRFRLTTLPARPVVLVSLTVSLASAALILASYNIEPASVVLGAGGLQILSLADAARIFQISPAPPSLAFTGVILLASWWATATYAYLSLHQLRLINAIYTHYTDIRMFRLGPLYAFSRHTLRSSLGLLLLAYALFATAPQVMQGGLGLGSWILLISGAVATFLLPLLGIHRQLAREKERMLQEAGRRMESGVAELHRRMDAGELTRMDDLNKALASLEIERSALERVPTWPWERGTLRSLVAALLLPLVIWLIQQILQPLLAR